MDFYPLPVLIMMMMPSALCSVEEENERLNKSNAAMEEMIDDLKTKLKSTAFSVKSIENNDSNKNWITGIYL